MPPEKRGAPRRYYTWRAKRTKNKSTVLSVLQIPAVCSREDLQPRGSSLQRYSDMLTSQSPHIVSPAMMITIPRPE